MAELTSELIGVIRKHAEDIEFGQIILSFHGGEYIGISVKKDKRYYPDKKKKKDLKKEFRKG